MTGMIKTVRKLRLGDEQDDNSWSAALSYEERGRVFIEFNNRVLRLFGNGTLPRLDKTTIRVTRLAV